MSQFRVSGVQLDFQSEFAYFTSAKGWRQNLGIESKRLEPSRCDGKQTCNC
jgi:hypothetical protein